MKRENNGFQAKENDYWIKSEILNQFRRSTIQFMLFLILNDNNRLENNFSNLHTCIDVMKSF